MSFRHRPRSASSWLPQHLLALPLLALPAHSEVRQLNGEWVESAEDLRVTVLGGYVVAANTVGTSIQLGPTYCWVRS